MEGTKRATAWVLDLIVLEEMRVTRRPPVIGTTSCLRMVCGPPQLPRAGESRFDYLGGRFGKLSPGGGNNTPAAGAWHPAAGVLLFTPGGGSTGLGV